MIFLFSFFFVKIELQIIVGMIQIILGIQEFPGMCARRSYKCKPRMESICSDILKQKIFEFSRQKWLKAVKFKCFENQ